MIFRTFYNGKSIIRLSDKGIMLNDTPNLIPLKQAFFYTYETETKPFYHLLIQLRNDHYEHYIFHHPSKFTEALNEHEKLYKESFQATPRGTIEDEYGILQLAKDKEISWGRKYEDSGITVKIKVPYRNEVFWHHVNKEDVHSETEWIISKENIPDELIKRAAHNHNVIPYGIWNNNQEYWSDFYSKERNTRNNKSYRFQKAFLVIIFLTVLYITIWKFFL